MFEKLVVSTSQRRRGRVAKFFLCTLLTYVIAIVAAFGLSILFAEPKLADTSVRVDAWVSALPTPPGPPHEGPRRHKDEKAPPTNNFRDFVDFDQISRARRDLPPKLPRPWTGGGDEPGAIGGTAKGTLGAIGFGTPSGDPGTAEAPPRPPDPPIPQPKPDVQKPLRMTSVVLQGKAIERPKPTYPPLAQQIRLQGDVSVEVMISPDGLVESARVVGGHPILAASAAEAARRWRFQPTLLNGVPVRVTGVIVFVFKLSE